MALVLLVVWGGVPVGGVGGVGDGGGCGDALAWVGASLDVSGDEDLLGAAVRGITQNLGIVGGSLRTPSQQGTTATTIIDPALPATISLPPSESQHAPPTPSVFSGLCKPLWKD